EAFSFKRPVISRTIGVGGLQATVGAFRIAGHFTEWDSCAGTEHRHPRFLGGFHASGNAAGLD
ncbi:MAG TPA: hypothetical protein VFQ43_10995, partial [Nitrososphaera sp.]|nr:hypothetical protein [Nitrososphaera sp.]